MSSAAVRVPSEEEVTEVKTWLHSQSHLPDQLDDILIKRFILSCENNLQMAKKTIDLYFTIRYHGSVVFRNRDPMSPEIQRVHKLVDFLVLPDLTKDNYRVVLTRMRVTDPEAMIYNDWIKTFFMLQDIRLTYEPEMVNGEVHIIDCTGSSLRHLTRWVLSTVKINMNYLQNAMPVRLRQLHLLNSPAFVDKIFYILKPFMREGVMKYIFTYPVGSDTIYDHFPKEMFPNEYGGKAGSIMDIKYVTINKMEEMKDYFLKDDSMKVDESKRPKSGINKAKINGKPAMDHSFKSLSID